MTVNPKQMGSNNQKRQDSWLARNWRDMWARPLTDYTVIMCCVLALSLIGAVMVVSASTTWSELEHHSVWYFAFKQIAIMVVGLFVMWAALKLKPDLVRAASGWLVLVSVVLLVAVLVVGIGRTEVGSQSWLAIGPLRLQPSELAKISIAIWGASYLSKTTPGDKEMTRRYLNFIIVAIVIFTLIIFQGDVGMSMTFIVMMVIVLIFAGINWAAVIAAVTLVFFGLVVMAVGGGFRSNRFTIYFASLVGRFVDTKDTGFQSYQGFLSLAEGGVTGVGIGQSRAKWFYLPEAQNDFIFSIVGEETGLVGGAIVIALYGALLYFGLRCARKQCDRFLMLLAASLTCGVVSQAFINIAYVIGLAPVTGIQLPLISSGGSSTIITLGAMGLLASCGRHEPEAMSAMANEGRPSFDRLLLLPEPQPLSAPAVPRSPSRGTVKPVTGRTITGAGDFRTRVRPHNRRVDPAGMTRRGGRVVRDTRDTRDTRDVDNDDVVNRSRRSPRASRQSGGRVSRRRQE